MYSKSAECALARGKVQQVRAGTEAWICGIQIPTFIQHAGIASRASIANPHLGPIIRRRGERFYLPPPRLLFLSSRQHDGRPVSCGKSVNLGHSSVHGAEIRSVSVTLTSTRTPCYVGGYTDLSSTTFR
ncbi:hypothetical protein KM043_005063 [Ampulex compressa]|nr:hypothetical protein KM043_005063 [Ampulex compressa]